MKPTIISIIGAPGVGKSFLSEKLAKQLDAKIILESDQELPDRIIESLKKNIRPVETILWFRNKFIENIEQANLLKQKGEIVVMDGCLITNELHITTMTSGFKQEILLEQAGFDRKYIPNPDIIIFLDASEEKIKELILMRGRDFDTNESFIRRNLSIRRAHQEYYEKNKNSLIYINRDNLDFVKEDDLLKVVEKIEASVR